MAANTSGLSWIDFLFDEGTDLLKTHLSDPLADPSASQLVVQFLERSGISVQQQPTSDAVPLVDNKRGKRLKELALQVGFYLKWNLETFEESLSLHWQNLFFSELLKLQSPTYQNVKNGLVLFKELEEKSAMALIIYCRWVIRSLAQHFLPNIGTPKTNLLEAAENENILKNLKEELSTCISILEDTLILTKDLELPCPLEQNTTSLKTSKNEQDPEFNNDGSCEMDDTMKNERLDEGKTVKIADIKAQVSFDLGTLYFYQEKFEKAAKLFQHCKEAKCSKSSCYTVQDDMVHGYYTACCGLLDSTTGAMHRSDAGREHKTSFLEQVQYCRSSSHKDLVQILVADNLNQELPMDYRSWLQTDIKDSTLGQPVSLQWQIEVCNIIRLVLEGQLTDSAFWSTLRKVNTKNHLEFILSLCVQTLQKVSCTSKQSLENDARFQMLRSFVCLVCSCFEDGFKVAGNSEAEIFFRDFKVDKQLKMVMKAKALDCIPANIHHDLIQSDDKDLKCGYLLQNLRLSFNPEEIDDIVQELHVLQPSRRFHLENLSCMTCRTCLDDIQDPLLQDLLHIIFSKAWQCGLKKEYELCVVLLQYALIRLEVAYAHVGSVFERVKVAVNQELMVIGIHKDKSKKQELVTKLKSYIHQTSNQHDLLPHVEKSAVVYLLNNKELAYLSNLETDAEGIATGFRRLGSLLAAACLSVTKPQQWRKSIRLLWDGVLRIFSSTVQHKRLLDGRPAIPVRRNVNSMNLSSFLDFINQIQEETCLTVVISCLARLHNLSKEGQENAREIFSSCSYLWPTSVTNRSAVNFEEIDHAMLHTTKHAVTVYPCNAAWLLTLGDIYLGSNNFSWALKCYLEAGACSSSLFSSSIPLTVWDTQIFKKMVECCMELKAYIQAALLCQCVDPKDYTTAFKAIQLAAMAAGEDAMDQYYMLFWDVTMLEYLINTHFQQGQHEKKVLAIQTISQAELNIFNNQDVLDHAENIRKASLFRDLAKQYL